MISEHINYLLADTNTSDSITTTTIQKISNHDEITDDNLASPVLENPTNANSNISFNQKFQSDVQILNIILYFLNFSLMVQDYEYGLLRLSVKKVITVLCLPLQDAPIKQISSERVQEKFKTK